MIKYQVEYHEGPAIQPELEIRLNARATAGWRLVSTIAAPPTEKTPFIYLLIYEREG